MAHKPPWHSVVPLLVILLGVGSTHQMATNSRLAVFLGSAVFAGLVSFVVGTVGVVFILLAQRLHAGRPHARRDSSKSLQASESTGTPWWAYLGGVIGSAYMVAIIFATVGSCSVFSLMC